MARFLLLCAALALPHSFEVKAAEEDAEEKPAVVLMELSGRGVPRPTLSALDDLLAVTLQNLSSYRVISPKDISALLGREELKDKMGCNDVTCAAEIGGALGARYLLWGSANKLGKTLVVTLSLIDSKHQRPVGRGKIQVADDESKYAAAIEGAVGRLLKLPKAKQENFSFGTRVNVVSPTPIEVTDASPQNLASINLDAEQLAERALDIQDDPRATPEQKAGAWCALERLGSSSYFEKARSACAQWADYLKDVERIDPRAD